MTQPITKSTPDLNEKLAAARGYGYAQQALMQAIVDGRPSHVVTHGLDVVRTTGAMFNSTNPMATRFEEDLTPRLIEDTAEFLRLFAVIKQTEKLIGDWLAASVSADRHPACHATASALPPCSHASPESPQVCVPR